MSLEFLLANPEHTCFRESIEVNPVCLPWSFMRLNLLLIIHFEDAGWNMIGVVAPFPNTTSVVWIADVGIIKDIVGNRNRYPKLPEMYQPLMLFGEASGSISSTLPDYKLFL